MENFVRKAGRPVGFGLLFFVLRTMQLRSGFDPVTGLSLPSAAGTALAVCLALAAVVEVLLALGLSGEKLPFQRRFAPAAEMKTALVMGGMLLALGGALLTARAVTGGGIALAAAGVLGIAAGVGAVLFVRQPGRREKAGVAPLLPALFFGVFLVLSEYLPEADNPVLAQYYLPVLASAMTAYAFSALAGCVQGEVSPRWFTPAAELAAALCLGAIADSTGPFSPGLGGIARALVYAACALILGNFLLLQRRDGQLPPEEDGIAETEDGPDAEAPEGGEEA